METRIHDGYVIEFNERRMVLSVRDEKLDKNVDVHWTSYWGEVPSLIPQPNEAVELVYNGTNLIVARPKLKESNRMNDYETTRTKIHNALREAGIIGLEFHDWLQKVHMAMDSVEEYEWEANRIEEMFEQVNKINEKLDDICYKLGVQ